jgi:hypothetical protein
MLLGGGGGGGDGKRGGVNDAGVDGAVGLGDMRGRGPPPPLPLILLSITRSICAALVRHCLHISPFSIFRVKTSIPPHLQLVSRRFSSDFSREAVVAVSSMVVVICLASHWCLRRRREVKVVVVGRGDIWLRTRRK